MKKLLATILAMAMVLTTMSGCTGTQQSPSGGSSSPATSDAGSSQAAPSDEPVTIDFWFWEDYEGQEHDAYDEKWASYEKKGNITVNFEAHANSGVMHEKLIPALAAGDGPDIFHTTPAWMAELVAMDAVLALDDHMMGWESFAAGDAGEGILDLCRANQDHYYCVPWNIVVLYLYCRADLFEEAGVDYPETMEDFYEACQKLTKDTDGDGENDQFGFAMRGASGGHTGWASLVFNADPEATYVRDGAAAFNSPAVIEANQKFIDLYTQGYAAPSSITDGMQGIMQNYTTGIGAMFIHHIGSYNQVIDAVGEENVKVVATPVGAGGERFITSDPSSVSINAASENIDAALTFAEFMCDPDVVVNRSNVTGRFPWQDSLLEDEVWHSNQALDVSTNFVGVSIAPPATEKASDWTNNLWPQTVQRALMGEITSEEMIQVLADGII